MAGHRTAGGIALFLLLAILALGAAFVAFGMTGPKGIEERFNDAVGLSAEKGPAGGGGGTLSENGTGQDGPFNEGGPLIEGNPVLYGIILFVLLLASVLAYQAWGKDK